MCFGTSLLVFEQKNTFAPKFSLFGAKISENWQISPSFADFSGFLAISSLLEVVCTWFLGMLRALAHVCNCLGKIQIWRENLAPKFDFPAKIAQISPIFAYFSGFLPISSLLEAVCTWFLGMLCALAHVCNCLGQIQIWRENLAPKFDFHAKIVKISPIFAYFLVFWRYLHF